MDVQTEKLSQPNLIIITLDPPEVLERKEKIFDKIKNDLPEINGFRKGKIPRDVAENKFGTEKLYKTLIDDLYFETSETHSIVTSKNFKIYGDLKDGTPLRVEFIGELKPEIELVDFDQICYSKKNETIVATNEELEQEIGFEQKKKQIELDSDHIELQNLDLAIIDFEGVLEGEKVPFNGGSAKNFKIEVNKTVNGKKQFVDNFEDQMVGMKIGESREINVVFPNDYRDKSKSGKKAKFIVKLNAIKQIQIPEINDDFIKACEDNSIEDFKNRLKERIILRKKKQQKDDLKQEIMKKLLDQSKFSPIPLDMIEQEIDKEWRSFLYRMGSNEEEMMKKEPNIKEHFRANARQNAILLIKTSLVLDAIIKKANFDATYYEVCEYLDKLTNTEQQKKEQKDKLNNPRYYKTVEQAVLNDKAIEYLIERFL